MRFRTLMVYVLVFSAFMFSFLVYQSWAQGGAPASLTTYEGCTVTVIGSHDGLEVQGQGVVINHEIDPPYEMVELNAPVGEPGSTYIETRHSPGLLFYNVSCTGK